jgi:hypothetical protein
MRSREEFAPRNLAWNEELVGDKKPTDSLYHLSHGQREPVSIWSALSQRRTFPIKANAGPMDCLSRK